MTPEEAKATVLGVLAGFGTYKIMGSDIVFYFVGSSFPNWNGTDQLINLSLEGNDLKMTNPTASGGGQADDGASVGLDPELLNSFL